VVDGGGLTWDPAACRIITDWIVSGPGWPVPAGAAVSNNGQPIATAKMCIAGVPDNAVPPTVGNVRLCAVLPCCSGTPT